MTDLRPILQALGYRSEVQQRDFVKLLAASGAFGELPDVDGTLNDRQAQAVLTSVTFDNKEQAAHWLHDVTQEHMLRRPPGSKDYECEEPDHFCKNRAELLNALHHVGALAEVKPTAKHYDHVLVLGSMEGTVSTRLDTVRELYEQGVRFDKIHLLGSERPLEPEREPLARVATEAGGVATEMQMMIARTYEKSESWPEGLQNIKLNPVTTPDQAHGRANTRDTIISWLNTNPKAGNVLVISNQPNVAYQDAAVKSVLPPEFAVETVGARANEDELKISVALDAITRRIDVGFPQLLEALKTEPAALKTPLIGVDPASVKVDAAIYQFRSGGDHATGVTHKGRYEADCWDPILHGDPILVHERLDGSLFVADGHHRLDLAKRLNAQGTGPGNILAMVLSEKQGYTPQDVKIIATYKNIAHMKCGNNDPGSITDAARVFKEAEQLPFDHKKLLPHLKLEGDIKLSYSLHKLSDASLDLVAKGEVPASAAAEVAKRVSEPERQDNVMRIISAKLHQNYDNYVAQQILSDTAKTEPETHSWASGIRPKTQFSQSIVTEGAMPNFLTKLQQKRANAQAIAVGIG